MTIHSEDPSHLAGLVQSNDLLLDESIHSFFGYGNYEADYWFIGMEEGGGNTLEAATSRLETWNSRGKQELEDVKDFLEALHVNQFFIDPVVLQRTWVQLIRIYLTAHGLPVDKEGIKSFQKENLGRQGRDTCLLELMPLPSPGTGRWYYSEWSRIPYLRTRDVYKTEILPMRIEHLKRRIKKYNPRYVVFYGKSYTPYWEKIIDAQMIAIQPYGIGLFRNDSTLFLITKHPTARGARNEHFIAAGKLLNPG